MKGVRFASWFGTDDMEINAASNRGRMSDFEKLNSENIRKEAGQGILVLPVGSVEQHGPHLPLTVDREVPARIPSAVVEKIKGFVAPAIYYGVRSLPHAARKIAAVARM